MLLQVSQQNKYIWIRTTDVFLFEWVLHMILKMFLLWYSKAKQIRQKALFLKFWIERQPSDCLHCPAYHYSKIKWNTTRCSSTSCARHRIEFYATSLNFSCFLPRNYTRIWSSLFCLPWLRSEIFRYLA